MLVQKDYSGTDTDDLAVGFGDIVYANMKDQLIQDWLWVYSPKQKLSGYVPEVVVTKSEIADV